MAAILLLLLENMIFGLILYQHSGVYMDSRGTLLAIILKTNEIFLTQFQKCPKHLKIFIFQNFKGSFFLSMEEGGFSELLRHFNRHYLKN